MQRAVCTKQSEAKLKNKEIEAATMAELRWTTEYYNDASSLPSGQSFTPSPTRDAYIALLLSLH